MISMYTVTMLVHAHQLPCLSPLLCHRILPMKAALFSALPITSYLQQQILSITTQVMTGKA